MMATIKPICVSLALLCGLQADVVNAQSIVVLCDQIKGSMALMDSHAEAGKIHPDAITNGLFRIAVKPGRSGLTASIEFRDATGQFIDAESDGAQIHVSFDDKDKMMFTVIANYPAATFEKYVIRLDSGNRAKLILLQQKEFLGNWKVGIYSGSCVVQ